MAEWLDAYQTAAGEPFAFIHLDVDWARPELDQPWRTTVGQRARHAACPSACSTTAAWRPTPEAMDPAGRPAGQDFDARRRSARPRRASNRGCRSPITPCPSSNPARSAACSGLRRGLTPPWAALGGDGALAARSGARGSGIAAGPARSMATTTCLGTPATGRSNGSRSTLTVPTTSRGPLNRRAVAGRGQTCTACSVDAGDLNLSTSSTARPTRPMCSSTRQSRGEPDRHRIETRESPSWVAWREIEVFAP